MNILEPYYRISNVTGISLEMRNDGTIQWHLCSVSARGKELHLGEKISGITSLSGVTDYLRAKTAVALNLTGKGILHKRVEKLESIDQQVFGGIMPNANLEDFYVQHFPSGQWSFVSMIRKTEADRWLSQLKEMGWVPLMLSLGGFPIVHIIHQLNLYESEITIAGHYVTRSPQSEWIDYQFKEGSAAQFPVKLASERIDERLLVPYAAAFQLVMNDALKPVAAMAPALDSTLTARLARNKFRTNASVVIAVFFVLLLTNFLFLSHLQQANEQLSLQAGQFERSALSSSDRQAAITEKERLLRDMGWEDGTKKSILIDQLASLMPEEVQLREVAVDPQDIVASRSEKATVFADRMLKIIGTSDKVVTVSEWMARIKLRPWVKQVRMDSYAYDRDLRTGIFVMTLNY